MSEGFRERDIDEYGDCKLKILPNPILIRGFPEGELIDQVVRESG